MHNFLKELGQLILSIIIGLAVTTVLLLTLTGLAKVMGDFKTSNQPQQTISDPRFQNL